MAKSTRKKDKISTPADMRSPVYSNGLRLSEHAGVIYLDFVHSGPEVEGFEVVARVLVTASTLAKVAVSTATLAHDLLNQILPEGEDDE